MVINKDRLQERLWKREWARNVRNSQNSQHGEVNQFIGLEPEEQQFQIKAMLISTVEMMDRWIELLTGAIRQPLTLNPLIHPIKQKRCQTVFYNNFYGEHAPIKEVLIYCTERGRDHKLIRSVIGLDKMARKALVFTLEILTWNVLYYVSGYGTESDPIHVGIRIKQNKHKMGNQIKVFIMFSKEVIPRQEINNLLSFMFEGDKIDRIKFKDFARKPADQALISALLHVLNLDGHCKLMRGDPASFYAQALICSWDPNLAGYLVTGGIAELKESSKEEFDFAGQKFDSIHEHMEFIDRELIGSLVPSPQFLAAHGHRLWSSESDKR